MCMLVREEKKILFLGLAAKSLSFIVLSENNSRTLYENNFFNQVLRQLSGKLGNLSKLREVLITATDRFLHRHHT